MTNYTAPWIIATLISLIIWTILAQLVMGDSRQTCTASAEICAWELR